MTKNLIVRKTKNGKGVFANRNFEKGEKIIKFGGDFFTYEQLPKPYSKVKDYYVQIGKNLLLGPSKGVNDSTGIDDFFNHSCEPNSGLKIKGKKVELFAIKNIKKGREITWDYSTTIDEVGNPYVKEEPWQMKCSCGSKNCRKLIRDFKFLPKRLQKSYIKLGIVPKYAKESIGH